MYTNSVQELITHQTGH